MFKPKDDPHGVTGDELKVALRSCFTAHVGMADSVLRLLLEKLVEETAATQVLCAAFCFH